MSANKSGTTEVVVVGAGPGGYAAAFHAAELGKEVTLVDAGEHPGGVCLHRGCIPSKALLHAARVITESREAAEIGLSFGEPKLDLDKLRGWKDGIVTKLASGVEELCKRRKVEYVSASARFTDSETLRLQPPAGEPATLRFRHAILASGSSPAVPPVFQSTDPRIMDSTGALRLEEISRSLLIIGGGYIGLELGTVYATLGARVTVVELLDGLLPGADRDLVRPLEQRLKGMLEAVYLRTKVTELVPQKKGVKVVLSGENASENAVFDRVLVAIGRHPNSAGLGLENTAVQVNERGFVVVDRCQRTPDPHIFAIGDVAGEPMLAHKASREGKVAAEVIAGHRAEFDNIAIPAVVFTDPEIAWCGLTETRAQAEGKEVVVARFPWAASGRAATFGRADGVTKLILEPTTERVLGVGITGVGAGDLIAEGALAVEMAAAARDISDTIHAHPTLSETMMEAAEAFFGESTHLYRPKR